MFKTAKQQAQDAARDERARRRQARKEQAEEDDRGVWDYLCSRLGITLPSQADAAVASLREVASTVDVLTRG